MVEGTEERQEGDLHRRSEGAGSRRLDVKKRRTGNGGGGLAALLSVPILQFVLHPDSMQKSLSDLVDLPEAELARIIDHEPLLVTQHGEPRFVAQSLESFEAMVRRLRQLESAAKQSTGRRPGRVILLRP